MKFVPSCVILANAAVEVPELARLGVDPVADGLTRDRLAALVRGRRRQLKAFLLDQRRIAGIGNIYADEILHRARLRHDYFTARRRFDNKLIPARRAMA